MMYIRNPNAFEVVKLLDHAVIPEKAHLGDLGWDLFCGEQETLFPGEYKLISTGVAVRFPDGFGAFIKDRSSISSKQGIFVHAGVIDNEYRGEIKILMHNVSGKVKTFYRGDKVAQMVIIPVFEHSLGITEVEEFTNETSRGDKGFGSTGE